MSALLYSLRPLSAGFVSSLLRARWGTEENRRAALCPRSLASRFSTPRLSKGTGLGKVRAQETMRGGAHVLCTAREERPGDRVARLGGKSGPIWRPWLQRGARLGTPRRYIRKQLFTMFNKGSSINQKKTKT